MAEPLGDSLKKITRGAGIAMAGMFFGLLLQFIARYGLQANYGIFSLALAILTFATMLACLGLHEGATRCIAYFRGREETLKSVEPYLLPSNDVFFRKDAA
jgi:O-antigen/teichoic acid export membrane protein